MRVRVKERERERERQRKEREDIMITREENERDITILATFELETLFRMLH